MEIVGMALLFVLGVVGLVVLSAFFMLGVGVGGSDDDGPPPPPPSDK